MGLPRARRRAWLSLAVLGAATAPAGAQTSHAAGKVAITTTSEAARADFVKGRHLAENLRLEDSRQFFRSAIAKDPGFAMAHLSLANSSPTGTEFFEHLAGLSATGAGRFRQPGMVTKRAVHRIPRHKQG